MIVGFSGTQVGMSRTQDRRFRRYVVNATSMTEFHHGDCIGSDKQAHGIVRELRPDVKIVGHPPLDPKKRAFCQCDELRQPAPYLERDDNIAKECDGLVATPETSFEKLRSGTWTTVRRARKRHKSVLILDPQ